VQAEFVSMGLFGFSFRRMIGITDCPGTAGGHTDRDMPYGVINVIDKVSVLDCLTM